MLMPTLKPNLNKIQVIELVTTRLVTTKHIDIIRYDKQHDKY